MNIFLKKKGGELSGRAREGRRALKSEAVRSWEGQRPSEGCQGRREVQEAKPFPGAGKERAHPGVTRGPEIRFEGYTRW